MDAGSEGYYSYYYVSFTQQERKQLKELFGRDLFAKGFSGKDLTEEQVQRILSRITPSLKQWLKTRDILPFLKQRYVLTDTETLHLKSGSLRSQEQAVRLVEFLMNKGSYGIAALYLCLIESSEQLSGLPAHYQLAGQLKQIVQTECGVSQVVPLGVRGEDDDQPPQSLYLAVENLRGISVTPETSQAFITNLGFSTEEFHTVPANLLSICKLWMDKRSTCYMEELVEALVHTQGLGRYTTQLCHHRNGNLVELRNFFISLGDKWQDVAKYLGFSAEEIQELVHPQPDNTEIQVTKFLQVWQLPDCGQRILPLMHKLKSLAGIVEPRNPSRRLDDRPGTLGYMNRHLKTDITGIPHRSLDTYTHTSTHPPPASSHLHTANPSIREPARPTSPSYPSLSTNASFDSRHTHSDHCGHSHRTLLLIFHEQPHTYDSHESHMPNSNWTDIGDQQPVIEELSDDDSTTATPAKRAAPGPPPKSSHSEVSLQPAHYQATMQDQRLSGKEVEARRVVPPGVTQQGLYGNEVLPGSSQVQPQQENLFGNEVFPSSTQSQGQLFGNEVFPSSTQSQGQLFGNEVLPSSTQSQGQLFGNEVLPSSTQSQGQLFRNEVLSSSTQSQGQLFGNEVFPNGGPHTQSQGQLFGNEVFGQDTKPLGQLFGNEVFPNSVQPQGQLFGNEVLPGVDGSLQRQPFGNEMERKDTVGEAVMQEETNDFGNMNSQPSQPEDDLHNTDISAPVLTTAKLPSFQPLTSSTQQAFPNELVSSQPHSLSSQANNLSSDADSVHSEAEMLIQNNLSNGSQVHNRNQLASDQALQETTERADSIHNSTSGSTPSPIPLDEFASLESQEHGDIVERDDISRDNTTNVQETCVPDVIDAIEDPEGLEMLTALVASGANINLPTEDGAYPIHHVVSSGNPEKMLLLLNNNANVNATRSDGKTPLHVACIKQDFPMVQMLVERGANTAAQDQQGFTCLHYKETLESCDIVIYLVHNGTPVDAPSKESYLTPLLVCCFAGEKTLEAAEHLITNNACVNGSPMSHMKPLITASNEGHVRMVKLLLDKGADVNLSDQDGNTALLKACLNDHLEVARQLCQGRPDINVNTPNKEELTPLMVAVTNSNLELAGILISHGANVNCSRVSKFNLAGMEMPVQMTPLADASGRGRLEIVQALVENKAEVNALSENAFPPIAFAVLGGHTNVVEYLLKQNDLDASLNGLSKPFVLAVKCQNHQCAELLITRYRGMERLLEDATKNNMHELVEHIQIYKQMAANPQSGPVQQLPTPNPPPVTQATPPTTIAQQQLPQRQQPQQQLPQQQLPQQQHLQEPPPTTDEHSPQEEHPLNDFSDEALNQLNDEPSQQYQMQIQSQQTMVNNLNPNGATRDPGMPNPVASQQTAAEPHPKQPLLRPGSQRTPQQTNFVQGTQPNGSLLPTPNGSTSQHTSTQHVLDMPFQQSIEIGKTQTDATGVTETSGEDVDKSLFAPRPRSPPPANSPEPHPQHHLQPHPLPTVELRTPEELQHNMVEVLHEFAQICISAAVRHKGHEWLVDKAASTGYSHLLEFFVQYFDNSAVFARDGKLVAEFIGGAPSPLNFLLAERLATREDFESVLQDIGRPKFIEQLMMALHQFPGSEHLPWTPSGLMDALFNQHFSIGSNYPSSLNRSSLRAPSPPPPQPVNLQSKTSHEFPETGGHRLGRGEDEKPNEPTQQPIASLNTGQTSVPTTDHSSTTSTTASLSISPYMPMSNVISLDTPVSSFVPPAAPLSSLESTGDELNDLSVLDDEEPTPTETPSTGTTLPLPAIQQQSLPIIPPPPVTQATREGINLPPTTKPQLSDSSIVQSTAAPLSSKVAPSGPHASTNTISSSGKTDLHKETFQSKPSIPSPQQNLTSLPTFSVAPTKPPPTQPLSLSLDDSSKPAVSLAGGHTAVNQSLPGAGSHPPTPKTTARETPVKAPKTTQTTATLPSTHVTSVPAKAPSTRTVNSKTASPPTRRKDHLTVAKTSAGPGTPGVPSKTAETTHKAARQSRLPVPVKNDSPSPLRSTSTESLTQGRPIRGSTKKTSRNTVQRAQTERKQKQVPGPEKKEASMVTKPGGRRAQAEKSSKTPPVSRKTVASKITVCKAPPTKKSSGQEKVPSLTSANEETDPGDKPPTIQESFQHHKANPDDHTVSKTEGTLEGLIFSHEPVPDPQDSQLFKIVAQRINKWKILGRYLGLDDETLEAIQRDNHFIVEQCYKMLVTWQQGLRAEATYLKLAQSLKNIMREDLLPELVLYMADQSSIGSESGGDGEGERVLIHIAPSGNPDLQTIKENFLLQRRKGLKAARITLQYPSLISPQKAPLHFILPTLDDSSLRVVEELCVAANIREDVKQVQVDIEYIHQ